MQAKFQTEWPTGLAELLRACERLGITQMNKTCVTVASLLGLHVNPVNKEPERGPSQNQSSSPSPHPKQPTDNDANASLLLHKEPDRKPLQNQSSSPLSYLNLPTIGATKVSLWQPEERIDFEIETINPDKPPPKLPAYVGKTKPLPPDPIVNQAILTITPLFPLQLSRGIIRKHLAMLFFEGEPEVQPIVDKIARGLPLKTIPKQGSLSLRRGVHVLWDTSETMVPFIEDQRQLVHEIRSLFGRENVSLSYFDTESQSTETDEISYFQNHILECHPRRPVVILSDFGICQSPYVFQPLSNQNWWLNFLLLCRRLGVPLIAFLPYDLSRCPKFLKKHVRLVHWDRPQIGKFTEKWPILDKVIPDQGVGKLVSRLSHRNPAAAQLAIVLCLASKIERSLLRKARLYLVPGADAGAEAELMMSELVVSYNMESLVLVPDVQKFLRAQLRDKPRLLKKVWTFLKDFRQQQNAPHATRIEEKLNYLSCRTNVSTKAVKDALKPVVHSLWLPKENNEGLVYWALRVSSQLPNELRSNPVTQDFLKVANLRHMALSMQMGQTPGKVEDWEILAVHLLPKIKATVEWVKGKVIIAEGLPHIKNKVIELPDTRPRVLNVSFPNHDGKEIVYFFAAGGSIEILADHDLILIRTLDDKMNRLAASRKRKADDVRIFDSANKELSSLKIEEKIDLYKKQLKNLPSVDYSYKRQYIKEKIYELDKKAHQWKDQKLDDSTIIDTFKIIEDWLPGVEFTNRIRELEMITNPFSPPVYQIISAPMGYGKTRLLDIAVMKLRKQNWRCIHLALSREYDYSIKQFTVELLNELKVPDEEITIFEPDLDDPHSCGRRLGITIINFSQRFKKKSNIKKEKICIIIDQAEMLDCPPKNGGSLVRELFETFLPAMSQVVTAKNQNIQWRFIFSGRYISDWENKIERNNIPLMSYELKLLDPQSLVETINNYAIEKNKKPSQTEVLKIAILVLYFSGGHPKCMVPIIKDGLDMPIEDVIRNEKKYYKETILPVINDIKTNIPTVYNTAQTLSPVRKITRTLLDHFLQINLIKGYRSKFDIEETLLGTFLFHRKKHFLEGDIIRKLLSIHLRHSNITLFREICRNAIKCYLEELKDPESLEPAILAVELLFLELQAYCTGDNSKPNAKIYIESKANQILKIIEQYRSKNALEIIEGFIKLLERDQELKLNFLYLLDTDVSWILSLIHNKMASPNR